MFSFDSQKFWDYGDWWVNFQEDTVILIQLRNRQENYTGVHYYS